MNNLKNIQSNKLNQTLKKSITRLNIHKYKQLAMAELFVDVATYSFQKEKKKNQECASQTFKKLEI